MQKNWSIGPLAVGSLQANPYGLHDLHGNLWEWCQDSWTEGLAPRPGDGLKDEVDATHRVVRGGGFGSSPDFGRSASRFDFSPVLRRDDFGVRPKLQITP